MIMIPIDGFCRYKYEKLYEVELTTVNNSLCEGKMNFTLHPGQMCAGGEEGRIYCQEDLQIISLSNVDDGLIGNETQSGGPLTVMKKSQHVLIGTAISGLRCGEMDKFAVFSMICHHRDWIMKNMKNPKFCQSGPDAKE